MKVSLHQIGDNVDVIISSSALRSGEIDQSDDVVMLQEFQKLDFSYDSLGVD